MKRIGLNVSRILKLKSKKTKEGLKAILAILIGTTAVTVLAVVVEPLFNRFGMSVTSKNSIPLVTRLFTTPFLVFVGILAFSIWLVWLFFISPKIRSKKRK